MYPGFRRLYRVCMSISSVFFMVFTIWNLHKGTATVSFSQRGLSSLKDYPFTSGCRNVATEIEKPRANATLVMLTRNEELDGVIKSMTSLEAHFNKWFRYPYVFLNDKPFDPVFKAKVNALTKGEVHFGVIDESLWDFPTKVSNSALYQESIASQGDRGIMYGNVESYHKMCRFYSGGFYKHPLVAQYEWYWRIEPDVTFFCDITYDPFVEMANHGKKYGFTVFIKELYWTVPNLFRETHAFIKNNGIKVGTAWGLFTEKQQLLNPPIKYIKTKEDIKVEISKQVEREVLIDYIGQMDDLHSDEKLDDQQILAVVSNSMRKPPLTKHEINFEEYNLCHFWSNFEIARVDLYSNPTYEAYFQHLENSKGFYTERWGDAPVHSLAVGLLLNISDVHYFRDIGYQHSTLSHCPANHPNQTPSDKYDILQKFGTGCRCKCPKIAEIEDSSSSCIARWVQLNQNDYTPPRILDAAKIKAAIKADYKQLST